LLHQYSTDKEMLEQESIRVKKKSQQFEWNKIVANVYQNI